MGIAEDIRPKKHKEDLPKESEPDKIERDDFDEIVEPDNIKNTEHSTAATNDPNSTSESDFFVDPKKKKHSKLATKHKKPNYLLIILILLVLAFLGIVAYQNLDYIKTNILKLSKSTVSDIKIKEVGLSGYSTSSDRSTAVSQPAAETPAPTVATPDKSSFTIRVSNGNGLAGSALKAATILKNAGFNVVSQGNASSYAYSTTIIYYKSGQEQSAELVKAALSTYSASTRLSETLTSYDILVVVGGK